MVSGVALCAVKGGELMKKTKRLLAALLTGALLLGMLPAGAAEPEGIMIEAESAAPTFGGSWTIHEAKGTADKECSGGKFYFVQKESTPADNWVEFTLEVPAAGSYDIYMTTKDNIDRTSFQFSVNDKNLGEPIDLYLPKSEYVGQYGTYREHKLGTMELNAGSFQLKAVALEKSDAGIADSKNRGGVFDFFRLVPAEPSEPVAAILYESDFSTLPEELIGVQGWEQVELKEGYALKGISPESAGLLGDLTAASENLPEAYTVVVDMQLQPLLNSSGYSGGLTFLKTDDKNFYHHRINIGSSVSSTQLFQWVNGTAKEVEGTGLPDGEKPHRLRVSVSGTDIICYMDGQKTSESIAATTDGGIGFRVYNGGVLLDNLTVYEGAVPPPEGGESAGAFELPEAGPRTYRMTLTDEGVTKSDKWTASSLTGSTKDCTSVYAGTVGQFVKFQPKSMEPGWYEVAFWNIAKDQSAMKMTANIHTGLGDSNVTPAAMTQNDWSTVGTFYFDGTGEEYFQLTITTAGTHSRVADVRFVKTEDPGYESTIWHDEGGQFTTTGSWTTADEPKGADDSGLHSTTDLSATATWSDYPPDTGRYVIYYWNPVSVEGEARAPLSFDISSLDGNWKVSLNPSGKPAGWIKLCTIAATTGTATTVAMSQLGPGTAYADAIKLEETSLPADPVYTPGAGGSDEIAVLVNQIGYDTGKPKRASVPNAVDGMSFKVVNKETGETAFSGQVADGVAEFTTLDTDTDTEFYIVCGPAQSYDFTIGIDLIQRRSVKNALAFMSETRADEFCVGKAGIGWRDSHQFSFELNGMVLQYMANPSLYDNLPRGIIETATCEYPELRTQDEPDLVWLIQFAAQRYYDWGHNDGKKLHMLTKEQLAYFLYLYPEISEYVPEETYIAIRDYTISVWGENAVSSDAQWYGISGTNHDLYSVQTVFGGLKGSQPPGHSIVPNLLMYEVAKRDGLGDDMAQKFFDAAYKNCEYTIENVDITDPFYNKGQRMSEYITVPALAWFLEQYPTQAPTGLKAALAGWAGKTIARSDNLWDIRMAASMAAGDGAYPFHYSAGNIDKDYWTGAAYAIADNQASVLPGGAPKNEPGNQAGLQAVTYAAARVLDDADVNERLVELGVAAIDDLYGRNPTKRAAFYHFTRDFEGADLGWYKQYVGGNGLLGGHTAVIDANAPELCYPYAPENYTTGYTEGWVAYNTAWNTSLAYAAADAVSLSAPGSGNAGDTVKVALRAPLNMDAARVETGTVVVTNPLTGVQTELAVTERNADSEYFEGSLALPNVPYVTVSYGSGLFRRAAEVTVSNFVGTPVASLTLDQSSLVLSTGETATLAVTVLPRDATDQRLSFVSENPAVVTVTDGGMVKAVSGGAAKIVVSALSNPTVTAACTITVAAAAPQSLRIVAPSALSVFGAEGKAEVTGVVYSDGTVKTETLPAVTFSTEQADLIRVAADGILTALAAGETTITATATVEGKIITGSAKITVTAEASYDFLNLYRANQYTSDGVTMTVAGNTKDDLTPSYGPDRLKLTGNKAGNTVSFPLGNLPAGTYSVTLYSKYFGGSWAYGVWSFQVDGKAVGKETNFDQADKNGTYHDVPLGQITLEGDGEHTFTLVSSNGGALVPISVRLSLGGGGEEPGPDPNPEPGPGQTEPKIHAMDEMYKKVYTDTAIQAKGLNYRLYVPAGYEHRQVEKLPMLIYLNGAGSRGTDNTKQLSNLSPLITPLIDDPAHPCIIVVPQLPESDKWVNVDWGLGSYSADVAESNSAKLLMGLVDELKGAYKVDADRVYLMGQSFGGYGTWDLITRHPETFAAAVPMCGAASLARAENIKNLPLLVLHGSADPTVPVSGSREMVAAVEAAGSTSITYLEYEDDDHYVQRRLFEQPELYLDWLFNQKKGAPATAPDVSDHYMPELTLNWNKSAQLEKLTVTGGTATISGEQLILTPANETASAIALVKDTGAFADGMLTAHFTMEAITGSGGAGLILRAQDDKSYVHLRFTKTGLNLLEMVNGEVKRNVTTPYTLTGNRIACMRAELRGSALKVWVDNVQLYSTTIQAPALQTKGAVGLRSYAVPAKVDDLIWSKADGIAIAMDGMVDRQVYQRNTETLSAVVSLRGTADGAVSLRAKVVSWSDESEVILSWTDIPLGMGGAFETALTVPQGGWYKTQLEAVDASGKKTVTESGRWGVGINILCIGQSNMVGIGQGEGVVADDLASNFMNEQWNHLKDPYDKGDSTPISADGTVGNSMVPTLVNALIAKYGVPVGIIPAAKGGAGLVCDCSSYPRWLDRTESNPVDRSNLYGNSLYRARAAGGIELIVMNQGEHDVSAGTGEEEYLSALNTLIANYRKDLGRKVPFFYCQLGPAKASSWVDDRAPFMDGIRAAQARANDPANGIIMAAAELDLGRNSDNLHYTTESQTVIGARVANAIAWYYDTDPAKKNYYTGPTISGAYFGGEMRDRIEVKIAHAGGSDFTPAEEITGFEVMDGEETMPVSSAVRKDADTILLTLAASVTGEARVRYMAGLLPDVTGIVRDDSQLALPLNTTVGWITVTKTQPEPEPEQPSGGGIGNITTTIKNEDGSTTKIVKNLSTGKVVSTTSYPNGAKVVATTLKNGATEAVVTLPEGSGRIAVRIPLLVEPAASTVAVLIGEDGAETVVKSSVAAGKGIKVILAENAIIRIRDNSKTFSDFDGDNSGAEAIAFAASRELFKGVGNELFAPEMEMTRGMILTVLHRLSGSALTVEHGGELWYSAAERWAVENGLSGGAGMEQAVTKEQLAVLLYRYVGCPAIEEKLAFEEKGLSPWAVDAVSWAVKKGLFTSVDGDRLTPQGTLTRAETAAVLRKFIMGEV